MTFRLFAYLLVPSLAWESIPLASMRLVFRADASAALGTGHVMRCSSIAEEALARNIPCVFVGSLGGIRWIEQRLSFLGIPIRAVSDFLELSDSDVLIIDSYLRETQGDLIKRNDWDSIVAIVDEATPQQHADLYIHPGLDGSWFRGNREKFISGSKYVPLRKSIEKRKPALSAGLDKIVIFGGGADAFGFAEEMARILSGLPGFNNVSFFSSSPQDIKELDLRFNVFEFGSILDRELEAADLVFTTASTSSLEIVAREIPLGIACTVDNQKPYYQALQDSRVAKQIGEANGTGTWNLDPGAIQSLVFDPTVRNDIRQASKIFIDLKGASRIVDAISSL